GRAQRCLAHDDRDDDECARRHGSAGAGRGRRLAAATRGRAAEPDPQPEYDERNDDPARADDHDDRPTRHDTPWSDAVDDNSAAEHDSVDPVRAEFDDGGAAEQDRAWEGAG